MIRDPHDRYMTPDWAAKAIVERLAERGYLSWTLPTWEPHVGEGRFVDALVDGGFVSPHAITGSDLYLPEGLEHRFHADHDAVKGHPHGEDVELIIGNPPFKLAEAHVRTFLEHRGRPVVAMLLRLGFLESAKRSSFWARYPLSELHVFGSRPSFTGAGTDSYAYGLFVWSPGPVVGQIIDRIDATPPSRRARRDPMLPSEVNR